MTPVVAILPASLDGFVRAVEAGGGRTGDAADADAIVWIDPRDPAGLASALADSPARWVQLPFAGIERFFAEGVIDPGRTWTCAKGIYAHATAEQALTLMLAGARRIHEHVRAHNWLYDQGERRRLAGTTAVIVGAGSIGRELIAMLAPLRVRIVAVNRSGAPVPGAERTVPTSSILDVIPQADWIAITAAMTAETQGLIGAAALQRAKPGAWVINVARGPIVDTAALIDALRDGRLGGAALDVTDPEPLPDDHPLWDIPNAIVTSHTANTTMMALPELSAMVERNVRHFAAGETLEGLVDPQLGY